MPRTVSKVTTDYLGDFCFFNVIRAGDNVTEVRVKFIRKIEDTVPAGDD